MNLIDFFEREKKTKTLNIRVSDEFFDFMKKEAKASYLTSSDFIRIRLLESLERYVKEKNIELK